MKTTPAGPHNYYHYSIQNKFKARELRKSMTSAEKVLWLMIRRKQIHGFTFNRQRPVMFYIADFMCKELKLIIEVDGWIHDLPEQQYRDRRREQALRKTGFSILRFKNWEEVMGRHEDVPVLRKVSVRRDALVRDQYNASEYLPKYLSIFFPIPPPVRAVPWSG